MSLEPENAPERHDDMRVLLVPTTGRDADAIVKVLSRADIECQVCRNLSALCTALTSGAAAVLVSEESLKTGYAQLAACIASQPLWSDLPIIVLSPTGTESPFLSTLLASLGNVSVLERPVRVTTLLSVVRTALRARSRQYQSRDYLAEREQLLASERRARSDSERASQVKDEFLATLSHELRTPLSAVLGWSQILSMSDTNEVDVREGVKIIERNARAQKQIIEDLLDMSRIISGKIRLDVQAVDLAEIVHSAVDTVRPAADAHDIRIKLVLDPSAGKVSGDPNRLHQILWNLLSNAVKFTPNGGLVQVLLERVNSHLTLSVLDSGEGIDQEFLPFVFDRFRQANASITRKHGGLGLGLAIVKQLVELHGGSIRATSAGPGLGSSFILRLPLRAIHGPLALMESDATYAVPELEAIEISDISIAGVRVLILDDEPDARALLKRLLENKGASVVVCASTAEAMDALRIERPDVIVSDIGMPNEDGYSFIRRVRKQPVDSGGETPALALTAYARAEDRVAAIVAGFQHHLSKPVEPAELIAIVASLARR
jgi:signal transduction histidine kinase/CheY-like chemotaxis protein